jgi:amphi-Trp domain-containing protein
MDLMEITEKERLSREDAAARLHALADALAKHNDVEFDRGGVHFKMRVPDEVDFKLEIEIEDDERELEIELKVVSEAPHDSQRRARPAENGVGTIPLRTLRELDIVPASMKAADSAIGIIDRGRPR